MTGSVTGWVRWHAPELMAATLPTVAAVTVHPAWAAVTALVVGRWAWAAYRPTEPPSPPDGDEHGRDEHDRASA